MSLLTGPEWSTVILRWPLRSVGFLLKYDPGRQMHTNCIRIAIGRLNESDKTTSLNQSWLFISELIEKILHLLQYSAFHYKLLNWRILNAWNFKNIFYTHFKAWRQKCVILKKNHYFFFKKVVIFFPFLEIWILNIYFFYHVWSLVHRRLPFW